MTTDVYWGVNESGNWGTATNWDGGTPTSIDDVIIGGDNTGTEISGITVTINSNLTPTEAYALTLQADCGIFLSTGGTLHTLDSANFAYGTGYLQDGGEWVMGGSGAVVDGNFTLSSTSTTVNGTVTTSYGTIDVQSGRLELENGGYLAGKLIGAGILDLEGGQTQIATGFSVSGANGLNSIDVGNSTSATLGFGINFTDTGYFDAGRQAVLGIEGHTLTLAGLSELAGYISNGTIIDTGTMILGNGGNTFLDNSLTILVKGTAIQSGNINDPGANDGAVLYSVVKGASYEINGNWSVLDFTGGNGAFYNAGTVEKTAGGKTATIGVNFTNTGTVDVGIGNLTIGGLNNTITGTVTGQGTLGIGSAYYDTTTLEKGVSLKQAALVLQAGNLELQTPLTYGGEWDQTGGTLNLAGVFHATTGVTTATTLTLNGQTDFDGGMVLGIDGKLILNGATEAGNVTFGGTDVLSINNTLDQTSSINFGLASSPEAIIAASSGGIQGAWLLNGNGVSDDNILGYFGTIEDKGLFGITTGSGDALVQASLICSSTGTVEASNGTLQLAGLENNLAGTLTGAGMIDLSSGQTDITTLAKGLVIDVAALNFDAGTITLGGSLTYGSSSSPTALFSQNGFGSLYTNGYDFTVYGSSTFDGGFLYGPGELVLDGSTVINTYSISSGGDLVIGAGGAEQTGDGAALADSGLLTIASGASYTIDDSGNIQGEGKISVAGTLVDSGTGTSAITPYFSLTGTLAINQPQMQLQNGGVIAGAVSGIGTLEFSSANSPDFFVLASTASLTNAGLLIDTNSTVQLSGNNSYAQDVGLTGGGIIDLNGHLLTLSGTLTASNGFITSSAASGIGTLVLSNSDTLSGITISSATAPGGVVVEVSSTGSVDQVGTITVGLESAGTSPASPDTLLIETGGVYMLDANASINNNGTISISGLLDASANGDNAPVIGPEVLLNASGTLAITSSDLILNGGGSLDGIVTGAGTLTLGNSSVDETYVLQAPGVKLGSGGIQLNENTTIAVVSAASTNTVYAGTYTGLGGNFDLNGNTLTLSGVFNSTNDNLVTSTATSAIGTLVVSGTGALSGLTIDSGNLLDVSGSITQAGSIQIGEASGVVPASNADMTIAKGGFDTLAANASIIGNGTLTVQGTLNSSAATGSVTINSGVLVDNGTIAAQLSTLNVLSAISGAGSFSINASNGSTLDLGNLSTIGTVTTISFVGTVGTGGELVVNNTSGFDATLANFGAGDFIDLSGFAGVLTFTAGAHANQIDVRDSGDNSIVLNFATSQTSNLGSFFSTTDGNNVLVVGFK